MRRWAFAAMTMLAAGCETPRTELVVRVDSELPWGPGARVQSVVLTVRRGDAAGPLRDARSTPLGPGDGLHPLPLDVGVLPTLLGDTDTPVWVEALGCPTFVRCSRSEAVVAQRAVVRFAVGQTLVVPLLLASACVGVVCGSDQRCNAGGVCEAATLATVTPYGVLPVDAGARMDAAIDLGTVDVGSATDLGARDVSAPVDRASDLGSPMDVMGVDVSKVDVPAPCGPLELRCAGSCTMVLHDPANCGDCGVACPAVTGATATCMGGRCGYACDAAHADCDERPSNGCESERAVDHDNCGACGHACGTTEQCASGACGSCGLGHVWCAPDGCIDNRTDPRHCDGCETACGPGAACREFTCVYDRCDAGMTPDAEGPPTGIVCPDGCVDIQYDPRNCGGCARRCAADHPYCEDGVCRECPVVNHQQNYLCGGRCVDRGYDDTNCGTCGHVCPTGRRCMAGICFGGT